MQFSLFLTHDWRQQRQWRGITNSFNLLPASHCIGPGIPTDPGVAVLPLILPLSNKNWETEPITIMTSNFRWCILIIDWSSSHHSQIFFLSRDTSKSNWAYNTLISLQDKLTRLNGVITPEAVDMLEDELGGISLSQKPTIMNKARSMTTLPA